MARQKKYELVVDLSDKGIDILDSFIADCNSRKELTCGSYTITTTGGYGKVWKVHEKTGDLITISTNSVGTVKVNHYIKVQKYVHYVLTDEGVNYIKELVMERSL